MAWHPPLRALLVPALLVLAPGCAHVPARSPAVPSPQTASRPVFIEDDYPRALALARSSGRPLFVDAWAPWCHTCVSLRSYVFPHPDMARVAARYVWVSLDSEKAVNQPFFERFPVQGLPTLFVLEPQAERPVRRWLGSLTAAELSARLAELADALSPGARTGGAGAELQNASAAAAAGHLDEARRAFEAARRQSPPGTLEHLQAVEGLLTLEEQQQHAYAECASVAREELGQTPPGTVLATVAQEGLTCAAALPPTDASRAALLATTEARVAELTSNPTVGLLPDDRSSLFEAWLEVRKARGDGPGARDVAQHWSNFLETEAAAAPTPAARAVLDSHRLEAFLALDEPARALPMLEQSERDFPTDYNPPARLALAYLALHRPREALQAAERAETRVYGPRTLRVLFTKAEAQSLLGDTAGVKATLARATSLVATLPSVDQPRLRTAVEARRQALLK